MDYRLRIVGDVTGSGCRGTDPQILLCLYLGSAYLTLNLFLVSIELRIAQWLLHELIQLLANQAEAALHTDALAIAHHFIAREVLCTIKTHVLKEVCQSALALFFLY